MSLARPIQTRVTLRMYLRNLLDIPKTRFIQIPEDNTHTRILLLNHDAFGTVLCKCYVSLLTHHLQSHLPLILQASFQHVI